MARPNYRDFRRSCFVVVSDAYLEHSAKGSTWENHKYIKRINGTYYYPESYEGGRHLPKGESDDENQLEDWEKAFYDDVAEVLRKNPGLFDPIELANGSLQDFRVSLAEFAGINPDKLSKEEIERMQKKVQEYYEDRKAARTLDKSDIEKLAREVIRGNFGSGNRRRELLGENYAEVQRRVNELMKGSTGSKKVSEATTESVKKVEEAAKKASTKSASSSNVHSGVDINQVLSVYNKKK